ncbi:glycosyltransferase [Granulicoccus phenolivorans]|uniref:glycosyltransferase n=1 Tax=Granulicoccus phenolivorans TaxID=266854 RepID=UPI00041141A5|nr:glycosyltransferase [Granulicoccus phenolivorans]
MRIVVVSLPTDPYAKLGTADTGGMNLLVRQQAQGLAALGHEVEIWTRRSDPDQPAESEPFLGVILRRLPAGPPEPVGRAEALRWVDEFTDAMRTQYPADLVHAHSWLSGLAALPVARIWDVPLVVSFHVLAAANAGAALSLGEPPESSRRGPAERLLAHRARVVVALSRAEADLVTQRLGVPPAQVRVVRPGVDSALFHPVEPRHPGAPGAPRLLADRYLLWAGRIDPAKGADLAVAALAAIPPQRRPNLVLLGSVPPEYEDYADTLAATISGLQLRDRVIRLGPQSKEAFARLMREAALLLVPSWTDTSGLAALEAAASGVPVVGSRVGGLVETVLDRVTGVLIGSRDRDVWAGEIDRLLTDEVLRWQLGQQARAHALGYTWRHCAEALNRVYAEACHTEATAPATPTDYPEDRSDAAG